MYINRGAISKAKQSIFVVMYYIDFRKDEPDSKVSILMNDLVKAKDRGVKVSVILEQTMGFSSGNESMPSPEAGVFGENNDILLGKEYIKEGKNRRAFNYLKSNGIDVLYDKLEIYTHGKCIVVDSETVVIGSHNWTKNSLLRSNKYSVLIKDRNLAEGLINDFSKIQIDYEASKREAEEYVELNKDFKTT